MSAYPRPGHWFFVTYGLSELWGKVINNERHLSLVCAAAFRFVPYRSA
jgi:hypothetical protein